MAINKEHLKKYRQQQANFKPRVKTQSQIGFLLNTLPCVKFHVAMG
jgi:hypothetical protein